MTSLVTTSWVITYPVFLSLLVENKVYWDMLPSCGPCVSFCYLCKCHWHDQVDMSIILQPTSQMLFFPFPGMTWLRSFYLLIRLNLALNLNPRCVRLLCESENIHPFSPLILLPWVRHTFHPGVVYMVTLWLASASRMRVEPSPYVFGQGYGSLSVSTHHSPGGGSTDCQAWGHYVCTCHFQENADRWRSYTFSREQARPDPPESTHPWALCHSYIWV